MRRMVVLLGASLIAVVGSFGVGHQLAGSPRVERCPVGTPRISAGGCQH